MQQLERWGKFRKPCVSSKLFFDAFTICESFIHQQHPGGSVGEAASRFCILGHTLYLELHTCCTEGRVQWSTATPQNLKLLGGVSLLLTLQPLEGESLFRYVPSTNLDNYEDLHELPQVNRQRTGEATVRYQRVPPHVLSCQSVTFQVSLSCEVVTCLGIFPCDHQTNLFDLEFFAYLWWSRVVNFSFARYLRKSGYAVTWASLRYWCNFSVSVSREIVPPN